MCTKLYLFQFNSNAIYLLCYCKRKLWTCPIPQSRGLPHCNSNLLQSFSLHASAARKKDWKWLCESSSSFHKFTAVCLFRGQIMPLQCCFPTSNTGKQSWKDLFFFFSFPCGLILRIGWYKWLFSLQAHGASLWPYKLAGSLVICV